MFSRILLLPALVLFTSFSAFAADGLELKRVMLSTGGVGYFEYEAEVEGKAQLPLHVRLDQVNDVMKSIVVYDDQGGVGEISLPGKQPLKEVFREMPFGPNALQSPIAMLGALRGAEIEVAGNKTLRGKVIGVQAETVVLPDQKGTLTQHRVSVMTNAGVSQFILEQAENLRFTDDELQGQLNKALEALARHNEQDRRTLMVNMSGAGKRTVRVGYVVEAPLWKTAYRLTVSSDSKNKQADFQGWAVLENLSGEDWDEVELTVVSGNPVTFRQALYDAYYVKRPEIPVEVLGRILPSVDKGAIDTISERERAQKRSRSNMMAGRSAPMPMAMESKSMISADMAFSDVYEEEMPMSAPPRAAQLAAAESTEATTQVIFRVPRAVTVESGHSLLVPIASSAIPVERVSLYQPSTHDLHPLASVRLTNTGNGLPPGVLTIYERSEDSGVVSFVGDAQLGAFPAGEERLVSFALDQKVKITKDYSSTQKIAQGKIVDGVLQLQLRDRNETTYTISGAAKEYRKILIEHPKMGGWDLLEPKDGDIEVTPSANRIPAELSDGQTKKLKVVFERPTSQRVELTGISDYQIRYYAEANELDKAVRRAIAKIGEHKAEITEAQRSLDGIQQKRRDLESSQERVRRNLTSISRDSDLYRRYMKQMSDMEDEILSYTDQIDSMRGKLNRAQKELADYVRDLRV